MQEHTYKVNLSFLSSTWVWLKNFQRKTNARAHVQSQTQQSEFDLSLTKTQYSTKNQAKNEITIHSNQIQKIELDFVHVLRDLFLAENWILVKLKSNSKDWVWLCTCAPALVSNWQLNFSQTQVKLKNLSLTLYMRSQCGF